MAPMTCTTTTRRACPWQSLGATVPDKRQTHALPPRWAAALGSRHHTLSPCASLVLCASCSHASEESGQRRAAAPIGCPRGRAFRSSLTNSKNPCPLERFSESHGAPQCRRHSSAGVQPAPGAVCGAGAAAEQRRGQRAQLEQCSGRGNLERARVGSVWGSASLGQPPQEGGQTATSLSSSPGGLVNHTGQGRPCRSQARAQSSCSPGRWTATPGCPGTRR